MPEGATCINTSDRASRHSERNAIAYLRLENVAFIEPDIWPPTTRLITPFVAPQERVYHGRKFDRTVGQLKQAIVLEWRALLYATATALFTASVTGRRRL